MTTYDHTELRKQYEAEAAVNQQAYRNWQVDNGYAALTVWENLWGPPRFNAAYQYRRDPSKPPVLSCSAKEAAMERAGEIQTNGYQEKM